MTETNLRQLSLEEIQLEERKEKYRSKIQKQFLSVISKEDKLAFPELGVGFFDEGVRNDEGELVVGFNMHGLSIRPFELHDKYLPQIREIVSKTEF